MSRFFLGGLLLATLATGAPTALAQGPEIASQNELPPEGEPAEAETDGAEDGEPEGPAPGGAPDGGPGTPVQARVRYPSVGVREEQTRVEEMLRASPEAVPLYLVFEEMIEELVSELQDEARQRVSPLAVRRVRVSPSLAGWYADQLEAKIIAAISQHTPHTIRRCVTCGSLRSRVEGDDWVVSLGISDQAQLRREAELLGVQAFLDVRAGYYPADNVATLMAEVFSAEDGTVLWARSYRSDATTAAILRTGDRIESREERVEELERRLDNRPLLSHRGSAGVAFIPYDGPQGTIFGLTLGYHLQERFGAAREWIFLIGAEGFLNWSDEPLFGAFIHGSLQYELLGTNLHEFSLRTGPGLGGFIAGEEGNSFVAEWSVEGVFQFMLGAGVSAFYFLPVTLSGFDLGGFGGRAHVTVTFQ